MSEEGKSRVAAGDNQQQPHYGTFQGVATYSPPAIGFPQPVPPPGAAESSAYPPSHPPYYAPGYQTVTGYAVAEGRPVRERRLACCGLGVGWFLLFLLHLQLFLVRLRELMSGESSSIGVVELYRLDN
ncbi:large ribosomal subunit protein eL20z-like isoform X2 [Malania oleifera]|uniref:large ribosomal subunit protein eL20z-like isoform X2 n=1 Tax=Malania oleifera TaxID=397392 RepID=UPI0025ADB942|nr:large ribosomal subunit protein eL20z-like isoform X2 [Malania oleifera]